VEKSANVPREFQRAASETGQEEEEEEEEEEISMG